MRSPLLSVAAMLIAALLVNPTAAQTVRDAAAPSAPAGTGVIEGTVVAAEGRTGSIRLAHVVLIGAVTGALRVTSTDNEGRFTFGDLPADRYVVGASKAPYLGAVAGSRRPGRAGTPIALADGQRVTGVTIRLVPGAAITGIVRTESGLPASNVEVTVLHPRMLAGERVLQPAPVTGFLTDDRGRYRVHGLPAGEYVVMAMPRVFPVLRVLSDADVDAAIRSGRGSAPQNPVTAPASAPPERTTYVPVFFPGTVRASDAAPIVIGTGEERRNVDFQLELVKVARVEGQVIGIDGQTPRGLSIELMPSTAGFSAVGRRVGMVRPDGGFTLTDVAPGSYSLLARLPSATPSAFGSTPIEVAGADLTGLVITLRPPVALSARLVLDGEGVKPSMSGLRVAVRALSAGTVGVAAPTVGLTDAAGSFTVSGLLTGRYVIGGPVFFGATQDSVTWALQSVSVDGRDVTDLPIEISADLVPKDVVVTLSDRWQELSGRLLTASGAPASEHTIVVFPADRAYWIPGSRRILTARPGTDGRFSVGGPGPLSLPAGAYVIAAATDVGREEQFDPSFLDSLVPAAVRVTVLPGEKKVQDLSIR